MENGQVIGDSEWKMDRFTQFISRNDFVILSNNCTSVSFGRLFQKMCNRTIT